MSSKLLLTAASADANVTAAVIIVCFWRSSRVWVESEGGVRTDPPSSSLADKRGDLHTALISSYEGLVSELCFTRMGEREAQAICARIGKVSSQIFFAKMTDFHYAA